MRKIVIILLMMLGWTVAKSQTYAEWTSQKKTQIKYLLAQIAVNKIYIDYIGKGYGIARNGLNTIQRIKKGDFELHQDFINALSDVNPKIRSYSRIADIITCQLRIVKDAKVAIRKLKESNQFSIEELDYSKTIFERLLEECLKSINELFLVLTSGKLEMKDDERIKRIDQIYLDIQDKYTFCKSFSQECSMLAMQRMVEQGEINLSKKLNGLK